MEINVEKTKVMRISRQPYPIKIMIDQKQFENVEYFNYWGNMITNDATRGREIKSRSAENGTFRILDQKYLESSEMCCWRRMEEISWTDRVRNEEVLHSHGGEECPIYNKKKTC
jgi:hypothetical protein